MPTTTPSSTLPENAVLLFQGDSITDCLRDRTREHANDPAALGAGYVGRIAGDLLGTEAGSGWRFLNRAVSGDRTVDLIARWSRDALVLQPDLVSILVGVNDTWHAHLNGGGVSVPRYAAVYRMLIEDLRLARPGVRLVLGEPFVLPGGEFRDAWVSELRERSAVVRELARDFGAVFVAYQEMFDAALKHHTPAQLAADGVHPSPLGYRLMAEAWKSAVGF